MRQSTIVLVAAIAFPGLLSRAQPADGEAGTEALAKAVQNPVANLISIPFQNNTNFPIGPFHRVQNVLNIQPVIPFKLTDNWNLITRTILPIVFQPAANTPTFGTSGFGDLSPTFFLSPARVGKLIWGIGPTFSLRTETNSVLGNGKWGAGPAVVALVQPRRWTIGALVNNIWSFAGDRDRPDANAFLMQYFINYNFDRGWYFSSSPIVTANWHAPAGAGDQWVIPFGAGIGRIIRIGTQPVNAQISTYYNAVRPNAFTYPSWSVRFQIVLLYPTRK